MHAVYRYKPVKLSAFITQMLQASICVTLPLILDIKMSEEKTSLRANAFAFLLVSVCLGILCCWYGAKTEEVYDKLRHEDFYLPEELKGVAFAEPSSGDAEDADEGARIKRQVASVHYYRLAGTAVEPVMAIMENCISALWISNMLCYAVGGLGICAAIWFIVAHCLIFEKRKSPKIVNSISFVVYLVLIVTCCIETVLLANKIALLPILRTLAATVPLTIGNDDLYDDFQLLNKTLGPILLTNMLLVVVMASWFQARLMNVKIFTATYDTKEMTSIKRV